MSQGDGDALPRSLFQLYRPTCEAWTHFRTAREDPCTLNEMLPQDPRHILP